jgi:hypothetical protein
MRSDPKKTIAFLFPEVAAQWHPTRNGELTPDQVGAGSGRRCWWRCQVGTDHEWETRAVERTTYGTKCPFCAGQRVSYTNSLTTLFPEVAMLWHPTKNGDLTPDQVVAGASGRYWWMCPKGPDHAWPAELLNRHPHGDSNGCPFCNGKRVSVTNNLEALFPEVAGQWHSTKNGELTPGQVVAGSSKKVWWKCPKGSDHEWEAAPASRIHGTGCPFCAGYAVSITNSLSSLYPEVAKQWHPKKNGSLTPDRVVASSHKKYWWRCEQEQLQEPNHEWEVSPKSRIGGGGTGYPTGCPKCCLRQTSRAEQLLQYLLSLFLPVDLETGRIQGADIKWHCDIVIPQTWLIVEYDGEYWHRNKRSGDIRKTKDLIDAGWRVIRVREQPLELLHASDISIQPGDAMGAAIQILTRELAEEDAAAATTQILALELTRADGWVRPMKIAVGKTLAFFSPAVAAQWHPTRNGGVLTTQITAGSSRKAWWQCPVAADHEWEATVSNRTANSSGCPFCANQRTSTTNNLLVKYPEIASQWHPTKNGLITPDQVVAGSGRRFWWWCRKDSDHVWQSRVVDRTTAGHGCPFCARSGSHSR